MTKQYNRWKAHRLFLWLAVLALCTVSCTAVAQGDLRLGEAAREQNWETVRSLLIDGSVNVNAILPDGATALAWAVYWDHLDTAQRLLGAGANPDIGNDYGVTPLILATNNHNAVMMETLLRGGADPNITLWNGVTPLLKAAQIGQTKMLTLLLEHEADVNLREPRRDQSALMWAISFGYPNAARLLIERGADVNARTTMLREDFTPMVLDGYNKSVAVTPRGGYSPIMFAARVGDTETIRLLIEHGVNVNSVHIEHGPPLVIAAAEGYQDLALFLLDQGADPNLADVNGMTALHYAMRDGLKLLHEFKVTGKPVAQDKGSVLPGTNMYELARALLAQGADPNAAIKYPPPRFRVRPSRSPRFYMGGTTPLLLATAIQDLKAMKMLLNAGADPFVGTEIDKEAFNRETQVHGSENQVIANATPFMVAVGMGRRNRENFSQTQEKQALEAARLLVNLGADVNAATASGWTPLHAAAFIGADTLITYLVEEGAYINVKNGCTQTPLSLAMRTSAKGLTDNPEVSDAHESSTELLLALGASDTVLSDPVGECVLGRAGLQVDIEREKKIKELKQGSNTE